MKRLKVKAAAVSALAIRWRVKQGAWSASVQYTAIGIGRAKFLAFEDGGYTGLVHSDEVLAAVGKPLMPVGSP